MSAAKSRKVAVEQVEATQDQVEEMQAALSEHLENGVRREAHVGNVELLDISIINLDTNESVEPQGSVRMTLEKDGVELPTVFHFRRDGVMEALEVSENSFVTESFSAFTSNYTVDFEYSGMRISISGNSTYALSDVLKWFNIEGNVDNASLTLIDGEGVGLALSDDCLSLSSDKPFQDVYQLDITMGDSVYHFYVTDAVSMNNVLDHLTLNFNGRTITVDKSGNVTGLSAGEQLTIRNGTQFSLDILFKEISGNENAQFASEMTYQLPGGLDASGYSQEFEIDFGDEGSISGNTFSVSSTGLISITLNTNDPNYHLINDVGNAQIKVKIAGSMNGTDLVFHGESDTTVNVTPDESHDTSVSKSAEYKDGRMYYTITASSIGMSQNVVITDKFTGELIKLDDDSNFTITSNKKDTVTNTLTKDSDNKGFKVEIPSMEHQETITIKYSAAIDPLPADLSIFNSNRQFFYRAIMDVIELVLYSLLVHTIRQFDLMIDGDLIGAFLLELATLGHSDADVECGVFNAFFIINIGGNQFGSLFAIQRSVGRCRTSRNRAFDNLDVHSGGAELLSYQTSVVGNHYINSRDSVGEHHGAILRNPDLPVSYGQAFGALNYLKADPVNILNILVFIVSCSVVYVQFTINNAIGAFNIPLLQLVNPNTNAVIQCSYYRIGVEIHAIFHNIREVQLNSYFIIVSRVFDGLSQL